jgi:hypothetical protein
MPLQSLTHLVLIFVYFLSFLKKNAINLSLKYS